MLLHQVKQTVKKKGKTKTQIKKLKEEKTNRK